MIELSAEEMRQVSAEVSRLATEYPDTVYPSPGPLKSCLYAAGEAGPGVGCLFGQALRAVGVSEDVLKAADAQLYVEPVTGLVPDAPGWWRFVQMAQDDGVPWGLAVSSHAVEARSDRRGVS